MCLKLAVTGGERATKMDLISYALLLHLRLTDISGRVVKQNDSAACELNPADHIAQNSLLKTAILKRFVLKSIFPYCAVLKHQSSTVFSEWVTKDFQWDIV